LFLILLAYDVGFFCLFCFFCVFLQTDDDVFDVIYAWFQNDDGVCDLLS
jgi:hypothetical protein